MKRVTVTSGLSLGLAIALLAVLAWRVRFLPPTACDPADGLWLQAQADARDSSYLLPQPGGLGQFRHAVYDLVQGRIRFFEVEISAGHFVSYTLADSHSTSCIERGLYDAYLAGLPMPAGRCVAATEVPLSASRYVLEGFPGRRSLIPRSVGLRDQQTGRLLARFQRPTGIRQALSFLRGDASCHRQMAQPGHPLWNLPAFVLRDRWGAVLKPGDLEKIRQQQDGDALWPELLPPPDWIRRRLAEHGELAPESCWLPGWMGDTEVHVLELERGPLEVDARLDAKSDKAGVVLLDVHAPDGAVVILAQAQGPTIWHVHESGRSSVVAFLVRGHHGQAVLGLGPFTRILMSTQLHNPYTNCTEAELREIEKRVTRQYGITRRQAQASRVTPTVVRYGIGEPMPDGGELFHHTRPLSDFEVREN